MMNMVTMTVIMITQWMDWSVCSAHGSDDDMWIVREGVSMCANASLVRGIQEDDAAHENKNRGANWNSTVQK